MGKQLTKDRVYNLVVENATYDKELDTYYTFMSQVSMAEELDVVPVTVNRGIKALKKEGKIDYTTKKGRSNSGHVITFNMKDGDINKDNPINGTTKEAKEVYEAYFAPEEYVPTKKYRSKSEIAEERLKKSEEQKRYDELNNELEHRFHVPKTFFNQAPHPENYYRGYILSRLYNAMLLGFAEDWKNLSEHYNNEYFFNRASRYVKKYENYDILKKGFVGTTTYNKFVELATALTNLNINPEEYLSVFFDRMFYKLKQGDSATPPHINNISSQAGLDAYNGQVQYKRKFENDHPYYATKGKVIKHHNTYPIMQVLVDAFEQGVNYNKEKDFTVDKEQIEEDVKLINETDFYTDPKVDAMKLFYKQAMDKVETTDLSEEEHEALTTFLEQNLAIYLDEYKDMNRYLVQFYNTLTYRVDNLVKHQDENLRPYFAEVGNLNNDRDLTILEAQEAVETGYKLTFSMKGSTTFLPALKTIISNSEAEKDYPSLRSALDKFDMVVPITDDGLIDANKLTDKLVESNESAKEAKENALAHRIKYTEDYFQVVHKPNRDKRWFKVCEPMGNIGRSERDGTKLTKENLNGKHRKKNSKK